MKQNSACDVLGQHGRGDRSANIHFKLQLPVQTSVSLTASNVVTCRPIHPVHPQTAGNVVGCLKANRIKTAYVLIPTKPETNSVQPSDSIVGSLVVEPEKAHVGLGRKHPGASSPIWGCRHRIPDKDFLAGGKEFSKGLAGVIALDRSPRVGRRVGGRGHGFLPNESVALTRNRPTGRGFRKDHQNLIGRHGIEDLELGVFVVDVVPTSGRGVQRGRRGPVLGRIIEGGSGIGTLHCQHPSASGEGIIHQAVHRGRDAIEEQGIHPVGRRSSSGFQSRGVEDR